MKEKSAFLVLRGSGVARVIVSGGGQNASAEGARYSRGGPEACPPENFEI